MMSSRCTAPSEKQRQRDIIISTHPTHYPPWISQWNRALATTFPQACRPRGRAQPRAPTHRWSMNVNLPSMAQRVTNSVGLAWTSLRGGGWQPWGRRRHTITRQVRAGVSLSGASASGSGWPLSQLRMYPVQRRVRYLEESGTGGGRRTWEGYFSITI